MDATKLTSLSSSIDAPRTDNSSKIESNNSGVSAETSIVAVLMSDFFRPTSISKISNSPPLSIIMPIVLVKINESIICPESSIFRFSIKIAPFI